MMARKNLWIGVTLLIVNVIGQTIVQTGDQKQPSATTIQFRPYDSYTAAKNNGNCVVSQNTAPLPKVALPIPGCIRMDPKNESC
jgi:hypothetical protein